MNSPQNLARRAASSYDFELFIVRCMRCDVISFRRHRRDDMPCLAVRAVAAFVLTGTVCLGLCDAVAFAEDRPATGPETERRFPRLTVPEGFRATLFACDPLVEYPSVIALGPESGTLFVAYDYMTGLGVDIVRRDEIRIVRDTNHDGYADESKLYAEGFNSIQGLAYHTGTVYVMHAPLLTSLKDTDGDGVADERRDLLQGLGLPPEENSNRLHSANGVVVAHDGWLYLALGDRGCDVVRPEGDRLVFRSGGILRCRPDGRDLHVFSRGLRNIYDIALDDELNVFVRDNENDGGDYMIRVCHCFHGSDHGYPYLYQERPDEARLPLADLGRGSSAGGTAYLETAFPPEYRASLFFCEWGRAVVRYRKKESHSSFAPMQEVDFAAGAADDPYGFKPTDLVVDRDGSLLVSDWGDGQRPKRGRGRIYRITFEGAPPAAATGETFSATSTLAALIKALDSPSHHVRIAAQDQIERRGEQALEAVRQALPANEIGKAGRLHAVWIVAHLGGDGAIKELLRLAENDGDQSVRAQAVRAIADVTDPVFVRHRLEAGRGDEDLCRRLASLWEGADARLRLEVLVALGRLRWSAVPTWYRQYAATSDQALSHAAMQLLRRAENWPAVLELLDVGPSSADSKPDYRTIALRALADQADETVVDGLLAGLKHESVPQHRREYLDLLTRVYQKPAAWTYWGFRPAPRPANSLAWKRTESIAMALDGALRDPDIGVRSALVRRTLREAIPVRLEQLTRWLKEDASADGVAAILAAFAARPAAEVRPSLFEIVKSVSHADQNRLAALTMLIRDLDAAGKAQLRQTADTLDEGPVLAAVIRDLANRNDGDLSSLLVARLASKHDDVRAAAAETLAQRPVAAVASQVVGLLADRDLRVRRAGATLAGKLKIRAAADNLLAAAGDSDRQMRRASLESLMTLDDSRAVAAAIEALALPEAQVAAIVYLGRFGSPQHLDAITKAADQNRSIEVLASAVATLLGWRDRPALSPAERSSLDQAIARIQGTSGLPIDWRVRGPLSPEVAKALLVEAVKPQETIAGQVDTQNWSRKLVGGPDASVRLDAKPDADNSVWLAVTDLFVEQPTEVEVLATVNVALKVWLDGQIVFEHVAPAEKGRTDHTFGAKFAAGTHRLLVELSARPEAEFRLRIRTKSSKAEHERLIKMVLEGTGDLARGRELFLNAEKSQCVKCHRLGDQGGRIGPDLTGIGSRFSRIHLVESVLEPSRTIAPSYETLAVALVSGQVVIGVKSSETKTQLVVGDNQGKIHEISKADIDELRTQSQSTMPDGLEQRLTGKDLLDLIEFLSSLKKPQPE